jgi:hypothetical protein
MTEPLTDIDSIIRRAVRECGEAHRQALIRARNAIDAELTLLGISPMREVKAGVNYPLFNGETVSIAEDPRIAAVRAAINDLTAMRISVLEGDFESGSRAGLDWAITLVRKALGAP